MISVADDHTVHIYGHKLNENNSGLINTLIRSDDRGKSWETLEINEPLLQTAPWSGLCFINRHIGLLVAGGKLYKTTDGGGQWRQIESESGQFQRIIWNNGRVFGFGYGQFSTSDDQGENWVAYAEHMTYVTSMSFFDDRNGYASAPEGLYATTNNGMSWEWVSETQGVFKEMSFADQNHGLVIRLQSQGPHAMPHTRIYLTSDGGRTWTDTMLEETTDAGQDTETSVLYDRERQAYIGCVNAIYSGPAADNSWVKDYDDTVYGGGLWIRSIQKCQDRIIACGFGRTILMKPT
jgi:photosystem II stability/assembly factor-like uncharacterized protein